MVSVCFSVFLCVSVDLCLFLCASVCFCVFLYVSVCFRLFPFVSVCFRLFPFVSVCFRLFPFVSVCFCVFLCVSMCVRPTNGTMDYKEVTHQILRYGYVISVMNVNILLLKQIQSIITKKKSILILRIISLIIEGR